MLSSFPIDLKKVKKENINKEILRLGMIAELDAISLYEQLAAYTDNTDIKKVVLDIAREEKTHMGEFQTLLLKLDRQQVAELEAGKKEVEKELKEWLILKYGRHLKLRLYKVVDNYKNKRSDDSSGISTNLLLISGNIKSAESFFSRLFGLIFKKELRNDEGLLFEDCSGIHTLGMKYCIDAVFLNKSNEVMAIFCSLKPFRFTPFIKDASKVLEFKSGFIKSASLQVGDKLNFEL